MAKRLPFGTRLTVCYRGRSAQVTVNDRGPYTARRLEDWRSSGRRWWGAYYVVRPGDTLWGISAQLRTTVNRLAAANGIANPDVISVG